MKWDQAKTHVDCHFLDSGAFTQWKEAVKWAKRTGRNRWDYFNTTAFWTYVDQYAEFIQGNRIAIDYYSNVDVIGNGELTWKVQQYLEDAHDLKPVPVVHYRDDIRWLRHYLDKGYNLIALGMMGGTTTTGIGHWLDACFDMVCDNPARLPSVRIHGFAMSVFKYLWKYPWWSVDSTSWTTYAAYGGLYIPHYRKGKFVFNEQPWMVRVSHLHPFQQEKGKHLFTLSEPEKKIVYKWLDEIEIPLGKFNEKGEVLKLGVTTRHSEIKAANIKFFERVREALPKYPWPFPKLHTVGFL